MRQWTITIAVLLLWAGASSAQVGNTTTTGVTTGGGVGTGTGGGIIAGVVTGAANLKGAPFSAETVTETTRVLQDGNHIRQVTRGKIFRDSEGRTRTEFSFPMTELQRVTIYDPVQQLSIHFMLNFQGDKIATVHHMNYAFPPAHPANIVPAAPKVASEQPRGPSREDLGTREIEGFIVRGSKITRTIEAGRIGNEQPIVSVTETWYSEELHQALLTETDDPQSGHSTTKLVNIQRTEPDPSLFQVPPDYAVKEDR